MAGSRILLIPRTTFSFPSSFQANDSLAVPVRQGIPSLAWKSGALEVLIYSKSITGTGAKMMVFLMNSAVATDGRTASDDQSFVASIDITAGTITATGSPKLLIDELNAPIGSMVVVGVGLFAASSGATSGEAEFEVWVTARDT